jgi:hypothetical protein
MKHARTTCAPVATKQFLPEWDTSLRFRKMHPIFVATGMPHVGRVALRARKSELKEVFKHFKSRTQHCCRIETET